MNVTCPSGLEGEIRKPKVREINNAMKLTRQGGSLRAFSSLLSAVWTETLNKGPYQWSGDQKAVPWLDVHSGDLFTTLMGVYTVLNGPLYKFRCTCGRCNSPYFWEVDLEKDIPVTPMDAKLKEVIKSKEKLFDAETLDGRPFRYRVGNGRLEEKMAQEEEPLLKAVTPLLFSLDGEAQPDKLRELILDMDQDVFDDLRAKMKEHECGPDTSLLTRCPKCGNLDERDLPFDARFFFPRSQRS